MPVCRCAPHGDKSSHSFCNASRGHAASTLAHHVTIQGLRFATCVSARAALSRRYNSLPIYPTIQTSKAHSTTLHSNKAKPPTARYRSRVSFRNVPQPPLPNAHARRCQSAAPLRAAAALTPSNCVSPPSETNCEKTCATLQVARPAHVQRRRRRRRRPSWASTAAFSESVWQCPRA